MGKHSGLLFKGIFLAVLLGCVVLPLLKMFLFIDGEALAAITSTRQFQKGLLNSLHVTAVATLISLAISFVLAWSMVRTQMRRKSAWTLLLTLPMLIPSISHSSGLIILLGANGILTKALGLNINLYGFWGIVAGSVMYSFPFAFLMIQDILKYESFTQYEVAAVLGVSRFHQLKDITAVYLRKPMISVVFSVFTMIFTDYGVPIVIGGKFQTLPVIMYHEVIGQLTWQGQRHRLHFAVSGAAFLCHRLPEPGPGGGLRHGAALCAEAKQSPGRGGLPVLRPGGADGGPEQRGVSGAGLCQAIPHRSHPHAPKRPQNL